MKHLYIIPILALLLGSCMEEPENKSTIDPINLANRKILLNVTDSLNNGTSYLSVYSKIYSLSEHKTHDLTSTVSLRNTDLKDSVFIKKATYYNTQGKLIRTYITEPIFLKPMETIEIVINERDEDGGTGANFIFEWATKENNHEPLFEGVMISTSGQQGLSFTTQGVKTN
ncbi:DUF3124 domain-containing protein [uncultured Kriegella sp.]|mgnify:CR=1 FL=1|uniref:DUF3124 domain-containing protein n=1 Tax=uncultured Kriegella sp. TaxID=1798910 RepID=UPI0030D7E7F4